MRKLILLLLVLSACKPRLRPVASFYYWKLEREADSGAVSQMQALGVKHLYVHLFDVDWDAARHRAIPKSVTHATGFDSVKGLSFTPVVFITNEVFAHVGIYGCDSLAANVYQKAVDIWGSRMRISDVNELQIDCDWTVQTKERYFRFLSALKRQLVGKGLSATIRLYPYKYRKQMGVPPVDRGVLMCYNLGNIQDMRTRNSIFDKRELDKYLHVKRYPLPLDVALPVFGWYVWSRNDHYKGILYESPELVTGHGFSAAGGNNFRVFRDTVLQGQYLRAGDLVRREYPVEEDLVSSARKLMRDGTVYERIIFYHWDTDLIKKYEHVIQEIYGLH